MSWSSERSLIYVKLTGNVVLINANRLLNKPGNVIVTGLELNDLRMGEGRLVCRYCMALQETSGLALGAELVSAWGAAMA